MVGGAVVVGGVCDLFLRCPAICGGSEGGSGGGDPDMGGVGSEAQAGTAVGLGRVSFTPSRDWSRLDLCFLKDGKRRGKLGGRVCCMEVEMRLYVFIDDGGDLKMTDCTMSRVLRR